MFHLIKLLVDLTGLMGCCYGFWTMSGRKGKDPWLSVFENSGFILGMMSNLCGIFDIVYDAVNEQRSIFVYRLQNFFAWMTVVVGFPALLDGMWTTYTHSPIAHAHVLLALLPLSIFIFRYYDGLVGCTILTSAIGIMSGLYLCMMARNWYGFAGSIIMIWNIAALSSQPGTFVMDGQDGITLGLTVTNIAFSLAVQQMIKRPIQIQPFKLR